MHYTDAPLLVAFYLPILLYFFPLESHLVI